MLLRIFISLFLLATIINPVLSIQTFKGKFDWKNIKSEPFEDVSFGITTYKQIKKNYKYLKREDLADGQKVLVYKKPFSPYSEVRIGFKKQKLDWVEFILKDKGNINDFLSIYGTPNNINKAHSDFYNYYNYDFFNISTDKKETGFFSLTLFKKPKIKPRLKHIESKLPGILELNFSKYFIPGKYLESDFVQDYPDLFPKINQNGTKTYIIKEHLISKYKKAQLIFQNGLLNFVIIHPHKLNFQDIVDTYGFSERVFTQKDGKVLYEYENFTIVTDSQNNVINIGIFSTL